LAKSSAEASVSNLLQEIIKTDCDNNNTETASTCTLDGNNGRVAEGKQK
jgi:hypothetical protein